MIPVSGVFVRGGKLLGSIYNPDAETLSSSFLKQFYGNADVIPPEIIAGADVEDRSLSKAGWAQEEAAGYMCGCQKERKGPWSKWLPKCKDRTDRSNEEMKS